MLSTITSLGILSLSLSFCTSGRTIGQVERLTDQIVPETAVAAQFTYVSQNPYSPTPIFESPIAGDDNYEYNNHPDNATVLSHPNAISLTEYNSSLSANLNPHNDIPDIDYYRFECFYSTTISFIIRGSRPNYGVSLYSVQYDEPQNGILSSNLSMIFNSGENFDLDKSFSFSLRCGTYYIAVTSSEQNRIDYTLNLYSKKNSARSNVSVSDLRFNKGALGAIWVSDWSHRGMPHALNFENGDLIYYDSRDSGASYRNYALEGLADRLEGSPVLDTDIYIWDENIKRLIASYINQLHSAVNEARENFPSSRQTIEREVEIVLECSGFVSNVISIILTVMDTGPAVSIAFTVGSMLFQGVLGCFLNSLIPTEPYDLLTYLSLLSYVEGYLLGNLGTGDVIHFQKYFSFSENESLLRIEKTLTYDQYYEDGVSSFCTDTIYSSRPFTIDSCAQLDNEGLIFGIFDSENSYELSDPDLVSPINPLATELFVDETQPIGKLRQGEYKWFSYTAAIDGPYSFLLSGSDQARMEFFTEVVPEYSTTHRISEINNGYNGYPYYDSYLLNGESIYIRVSGDDFLPIDEELSIVVYNRILAGSNHTHSYGFSYSPFTSMNHKSFCWCGSYITNAHTYDERWTVGNRNYGHCGLCDDTVSMNGGFIRP